MIRNGWFWVSVITGIVTAMWSYDPYLTAQISFYCSRFLIGFGTIFFLTIILPTLIASFREDT